LKSQPKQLFSPELKEPKTTRVVHNIGRPASQRVQLPDKTKLHALKIFVDKPLSLNAKLKLSQSSSYESTFTKSGNRHHVKPNPQEKKKPHIKLCLVFQRPEIKKHLSHNFLRGEE